MLKVKKNQQLAQVWEKAVPSQRLTAQLQSKCAKSVEVLNLLVTIRLLSLIHLLRLLREVRSPLAPWLADTPMAALALSSELSLPKSDGRKVGEVDEWKATIVRD